MTTGAKEKPLLRVSWINDNNISVVYLVAIVAIAIVVMSFLDDNFLSLNNIINVLNQQSTLGIATVGVAIALFAGCIDLTVGNLLATTAAIAALMLRQDINDFWVILLTCLIGFGFGLINGLIVVKSRIDTFIATLGLLSIYQGLALIIPKGNNVYLEGRFSWFGTYKIGGILPLPVVYFITFIIIAYLITRYTKFGRNLYSIGGNPEAAFLAGINLDLNKMLAYGVSGFCAAFTSLIVISRIGQSSPAMGVAYPLETIAAAVIGGVSLSGGKGTIPGVFMGVILLGLIRNSLNIMRVPSFYQYVMLGSVIIIAVTLSNWGSIRKSGSPG